MSKSKFITCQNLSHLFFETITCQNQNQMYSKIEDDPDFDI